MTVLENPSLMPYAPFLYTVWDNGQLSDFERESILRAVAELELEARNEVETWLDAGDPPSAHRLGQLRKEIREQVPQETAPRSLSELGVALVHGDAALAERLQTLERDLVATGSELCFPFLPAVSGPVKAQFGQSGHTQLARFLAADHREINTKILDYLKSRPPQITCDLDLDSRRADTLTRLRELVALGLGDLAYPGVTPEGDIHAFLDGFETLAFGDLSVWVKAGVQFGLFGGAILGLGTETHHQLLPDVAGGRLLGCFAMTERHHGSNVMGLETTATYDHESGSFDLHTPHDGAQKEYIGNAARDGSLAVVFAQLAVAGVEHGVHAFLVPIRSADGSPEPGVRIEDCGPKMGLDGVDNGRIWFDHVRVPRENLLDRFGSVRANGDYVSSIASPGKRFFKMLGTLVKGRVSVACAALSASKVGLTIALHYGRTRRQFGPSGRDEQCIIDYPSYQLRLFPALAKAYAIHFALRDLKKRVAIGDPEDERLVESLAAGLKAYATRNATETLQACRESCGGRGYLADSRLPSLKADTDVFTTFEGDNTVLWQLVAKSLLSDFKHQFGESHWMGLVKYLVQRTSSEIAEKNFLRVRQTDEAHLRDPSFLHAALSYREQSLVASLARRLSHRLKDGKDTFRAFTEVQDHAQALARAFIENHVFVSFDAAIATADVEVAELMTPLRDLFALDALHRDARWYLENGYIEPSKAKATRKLVGSLCLEVRPTVPVLLEAFAVPTECLGVLVREGTTSTS